MIPVTFIRKALFPKKAASGTFHIDAGEGLHIRLLEEKDAGALFALIDANRRDLREWLPWVDRTETLSDSIDFIRSALVQYRNCTGLHAGLWKDDSLIGVIGYVSIDVNNRKAMIGYWLAGPSRGKGYMTRACAAMVDVAFRKLLFNKVEIYCGVGNLKSRAIPERLGFKPEGVLKQHEWVNDHFVDIVAYGMLSGEWAERKALKK